ncbi:protein mono-ADP-ribosyltransferase PARP12-like [Notolabrus celidotus]|uniref:protein mono-ADP-ribosyltransferase PARP12-like n=1 Tax=Notolabrus celidotus TaxID=1203425 RepID=UPI0014906B34|nr:protein mono-ADP-ribosyltransferase PARP12-like [Notolabrus celidotus]
MASVVSELITKTLCDNRGCLNFRSLDEKIKQKYTVSEEVLRSLLFDEGKIAIKEGREKVTAGLIVNPDSLIVAKTGLRLCPKRPGECSQCDGLHLCRFYVSGGCTFGNKCKNTHDLASPHNAQLVKSHGCQNLTENQLFTLLLQNDPSLLPEICPHYNKGNGLHGSCKFATTCKKLHICQHYFQDDCKFGSSCKRAHNVGECDMKTFRGLSQENITNLNEIYRNKGIVTAQQDRPTVGVEVLPEVKILPEQSSKKNPRPSTACNLMSEADRNEICLFSIRKGCKYKEKCARVHCHLPYRWQVLDSDGVTWKDLTDMEGIEKAYCDPGHDTSCIDQPTTTWGILKLLSLQSKTSPKEPSVDFMTMTHTGSTVRRLSTASSVSKPPHFILTTEWLWYWKDENEEWSEFGQDGASVTSDSLESVYLADSDTQVPFDAGHHQYILHFKGEPGVHQMYQQNVKYKTKREVRRRPRFVSAQDVELKLKSSSSQGSRASIAENFPSHWDKSALPDIGYKLVPLSKSSEYNMITAMFKRTMPTGKIHKVQRIQNLSLWSIFHWQKEQMKKRNGGKAVNEQYLFHGTDEPLIEAICDQNFDWRMCGVHGTAYGKGSYFAKEASYSDRYAKVNSRRMKTMFVALVLVGEYTQGSSSYVRPPPKRDGKTLYDSCVNHESDPSIYVVFEKQQIYPEYLITYS